MGNQILRNTDLADKGPPLPLPWIRFSRQMWGNNNWLQGKFGFKRLKVDLAFPSRQTPANSNRTSNWLNHFEERTVIVWNRNPTFKSLVICIITTQPNWTWNGSIKGHVGIWKRFCTFSHNRWTTKHVSVYVSTARSGSRVRSVVGSSLALMLFSQLVQEADTSCKIIHSFLYHWRRTRLTV